MAITIDNLSYEYKNGQRALNNVTMEFSSGICGLLGHNGAGKTTFMKILTTLITPLEGHVYINDMEIKKGNYEAIRRMIGYLPQELVLYPDLTVYNTLEYLGRISGVNRNILKSNIDEILEKTNLAAHKNKKNKHLSGGMKRRVGLAQAMLKKPDILVIDEPTAGLDPEERINIRNMLSEFGKEHTILFSTHVVEDLSGTCNFVSILSKGELKYKGTIKELLNKTDHMSYETILDSESQLQKLNERFYIVSKMHSKEGIRVQFVSKEKINSDKYQYRETTLEDAYMIVSRYGI